MNQSSPPINIFSGAEQPLGAALTNPTELARQKGKVSKPYPVFFGGKRFPDAETAYQLSKPHAADRDELMVEIIVAKFRQHEDLADDVAVRGGAAWLARCSHFTHAKTEGAQAWEGAALESRFIRNLVEAYQRFLTGANTQLGQAPLF